MGCSFERQKNYQSLTFKKIIHESGRKQNKIWVDKSSKFYNRSVKSWLQDNDMEKYSALIEEKSVLAERFIKSLKNKIYKYMSAISKNMYIDKLNDMANKRNNTYYSTNKMKSVNVKTRTYIDFNNDNNTKDPKLEVGDHIIIWKHNINFAKRLYCKL